MSKKTLSQACLDKFGSPGAVKHQIALLNARLKYRREACPGRAIPPPEVAELGIEAYVAEFNRLNHLAAEEREKK